MHFSALYLGISLYSNAFDRVQQLDADYSQNKANKLGK
jgi:hypothetical protein